VEVSAATASAQSTSHIWAPISTVFVIVLFVGFVWRTRRRRKLAFTISRDYHQRDDIGMTDNPLHEAMQRTGAVLIYEDVTPQSTQHTQRCVTTQQQTATYA